MKGVIHMYGIVYKAVNTINKKCYIGQTTQKLGVRRSDHFYQAFRAEADTKFYNALRKHGKDAFTWEEIDFAKDAVDLDEKEIYYISKYDSVETGYNTLQGGECSGRIDADTMAEICGSKPFYAFNKGILIGEFINKRRFEKEYDVPAAKIASLLRGDYGSVSYHGYIFILKEEYSEEVLKDRLSRMISKEKFKAINKKSGEEFGPFTTYEECKRALSLPANAHIGEVLKGTRRSSNGYLFQYFE